MNFKRYHESRNLFDISSVTHQTLGTDGSLVYESAMNLSGFIKVDGNYTVSWSAVRNGAYMRVSTYDDNKNFIARIVAQNTYTHSSYSNTHTGYIRINYENSYQLSNVQVNTGSTALPYEPYSSEVWHDIPYYQHKTATDTLTLPATLYPTNTYLNVELKGNSVQNGTPSPSSPIDVNGVGDESDVPTYIVNAHIDGVNIQKAFEHSKLCELTAPNKPSEYFNYWKDENNNILSYNRTFTQRIVMDRNIYATYSNVEVTPQPCLEMYLYNAIKDGGNNLYWLFFGEVPDNYSVVEEGIMYTANRTAGYTQDSTVDLTTVPGFDFDAVWADSSKYRVDKYTGTVNIFTQVFNLFIGDSVNNYFYGKGYITIKNNTTQEQSTIYSDMVKGTYNNTNLRPTPTTHYNIPITCSNITYNRYLSGTESIRYIKKLVLNGTENWLESTAQSGRFRLYSSDYLKSNGNITSFCSHYTAVEQKSSGALPNNSQNFYSGSDSTRYIFIVDERYTTAADFKTYLQQQYAAGTPVTVWYVLAEPETSTINEPLMKIGNYTDKINTTIPTKGTTEITVDTTLQPSNISVDGFQNIEIGLKGNTVQSGTPSPDNPIMPNGTGDKTANLFDYKTAYSSYLTDNDIVIAPSDMITKKNYFAAEEIGKTLTISTYAKNVTSNRVYIAANINSSVQTGNSIYADSQGTLSLTVTPTSTNDYFVLSYGSGGTYNTFNNMMLVKGSTVPSEYIPFGYKIPISSASTTTNVYLGEVESTRRIEKLVLTGEEDWLQSISAVKVYRINVPAYLREIDNIPICTHYKGIAPVAGTGDLQDLETAFLLSASGNNYYYIRDDRFNNANDFKTYLQQQYAAGTPVCVWYVLATPQTAVVNEPLMRIGDYADTLSGITIPTIAGTNRFDVQTTLKPSEVTVNYKGWHPVTDVHERENGAWD